MMDSNSDQALRSAKSAWHAAAERDDAFASAHRERRLAQKAGARARRKTGRGLLVTPAIVGAAMLAGTALAATTWLSHRERPVVAAAHESQPSKEPAPESAIVPAPVETASPELVVPEPPVVVEAPRPADVPDPWHVWSAAEASLGRGDRPAAEGHLRRLLDMREVPAALRDRGTLALAEVELARGSKEAARARLASLTRADDASLAADAVFLLARASEPSQEVRVYSDYLARRPPSPYREQAVAEKGRALVRLGDREGARACLGELRASPELGPVAARATAHLERELAP